MSCNLIIMILIKSKADIRLDNIKILQKVAIHLFFIFKARI